MKNKKSPGSDGYTVEFFFLILWDWQKEIYPKDNQLYFFKKEKKELRISKRLGITSMSFLTKGDKPRQFFKN